MYNNYSCVSRSLGTRYNILYVGNVPSVEVTRKSTKDTLCVYVTVHVHVYMCMDIMCTCNCMCVGGSKKFCQKCR